jgi:hypothetical protein
METISSLLRRLSNAYGISLSTLKSNVKILKELNLISFGNSSNFQTAKLTDFGKFLSRSIGSWRSLNAENFDSNTASLKKETKKKGGLKWY